MTEPYVMRQATLSDLDTVLAIVQQRVDWLRDRGSDQWNHGAVYDGKLARRVERGFTWLLEDDGEPIATATAFRRCTSVLWTAAELAEPSLFAWKMATVVDRAGQGLTGLLYQWGQDWAARRGLSYVRWSVWGASQGLQAYYRRTGAELVRTVTAPTGKTAALFQLPARHIPEVALRVRTVVDETRQPAAMLAGSVSA